MTQPVQGYAAILPDPWTHRIADGIHSDQWRGAEWPQVARFSRLRAVTDHVRAWLFRQLTPEQQERIESAEFYKLIQEQAMRRYLASKPKGP